MMGIELALLAVRPIGIDVQLLRTTSELARRVPVLRLA
jgi:hypothetical protein